MPDSVSSRLAIIAALVLVVVGGFFAVRSWMSGSEPEEGGDDGPVRPAAVDEATLRKLCTHCHLFPPPESLPKKRWPTWIRVMAGLKGYGQGMTPPPIESIIDWYVRQAPEKVSLEEARALPDAASDRWQFTRVAQLSRISDPFVSTIIPQSLTGEKTPELCFGDMRHGSIEAWRPFEKGDSSVRAVGSVKHPTHIEPVDFDGDGRLDLLVANIGSFSAIDHNLGSVEWLRQTETGTFERITLCDKLSRLADARAVDLDGDGDLDLVVAEFGWLTTGKTILFENTGGAPKPQFVRRDLDSRTGPVETPIVDLNGDGRPDIVVLIGQQYEMVLCFINEGELKFSSRELFRAPHPGWGASGIVPVDLDGDGDLDFLVTNGDSFDDGILKPDHGITWLENDGAANFTPRFLVSMPGAHRALAVDADGDGDLDILACALAGETATKTKTTVGLPSLLLLEHLANHRFSPQVLERGQFFHPRMAILEGTPAGLVRFGVADAYLNSLPGTAASPSVTVWELRARVKANE